MQQRRDDRENTVEMTGTARAFQQIAEGAGADPDRRWGLVHDRRREDYVCSLAGACFQVGIERPGVAREILPRAELERVNKDRYNQLIGACASGPDQFAVPGVQCPHCHYDRTCLVVFQW